MFACFLGFNPLWCFFVQSIWVLLTFLNCQCLFKCCHFWRLLKWALSLISQETVFTVLSWDSAIWWIQTCLYYSGATHLQPLFLPRCLCVFSVYIWLTLLSCLSSPWRKRQLQFLLEGRGRRAGLSPEELRDNGKLLGEGLSRALFNYPSRDCSAESPEVSSYL